MRHYIYFHHKPNGEVFYVGQANALVRTQSKRGRGIFWHNVVNKYGFYVNVVHSSLTKEQANLLEKHYIKEFGRRDLGLGALVNRTDGADGGSNKIFTDETRRKMSISHLGKTGKKMPQSMKDKISRLHKGRKHTPEHTAKIVAFQKGRIKSQSEIEKLRLTKLGKPRPDWVRKKVSDGRLKTQATKVIAINDTSIYEFGSMAEAEQTLQRQRKSIRSAAFRDNGFCNGFRIYL